MNPSNRVHDTFRQRSIGKGGTAPFNSKSSVDAFHVAQSRLGTHDEWNPDAKNDWGGTGKYEQQPNDIRRNAISAMGDIRAKSSYRNPGQETKGTGAGPCCEPTLYPPYSKNPMYKKRRD